MRPSKKVFCIAALFALFACTEENVTSVKNQSAAEKIDRNKVWLVSTEATYAPFEFRDELGYVIGFDADLIEAIAKDQGMEVKILPRQWTGIFDTLNDGSRDLIAAAVGITPKRRESYLFSDAYMDVTDIAIYKDKDLDINSLEDLKNFKVAFLTGASFAETIKGITSDPDNLLPTDTQYLAFKAMLNGTADVAVGPAPVLLYYAKNNSNLGPFKTMEYTPGNVGPSQIAFVFKKGNTELAQKVNAGLKNVRENGTYDLIYNKWMGEE